jgi:hypothetical protein
MPQGKFYQDHPDELSQAALWSMITGIVGLCMGPLGLIALVLGIIGISKTSGNKMRGMGFAIAGTVLGVLGVLGTCLIVAILLPAIGQARITAQTMMSESRLEMIADGMLSYRDEHGSLPEGENWQRTLSTYLVGMPDDPMFDSPISDGDEVEYVFVPDEYEFDGSKVMFYEDPDHRTVGGVVVVVFDDGSVGRVTIEELEVELRERGFVVDR